jgi:hypothetical protein
MRGNMSVEGAILEAVEKASDSISLQTLGAMIANVRSEYVHTWSEIRRTWLRSAKRIGFHLSNPPLCQEIESQI